MPALRDLQRAVYRSLMERDGGGMATCVRDDGIAAVDRLSVYRNTFYGTLTNALRLSYPAVHRLVAAEFFEAVAQAFIGAQPPRSAYLDEYGSGFPDFLARFPAATSVPYLFDVAQLEWAVTRALHAPDATPLDVMELRSLEEREHPCVRFTPDPSVSLVRASCPADTIWRAVLEEDDAALQAIDLEDAPAWLLVQRLSTGVDIRRMSEAAWLFTSALWAGWRLEEAIDLASGIDVSTVLAEHLAAGRFIAFSVTESDTAAQPTRSLR